MFGARRAKVMQKPKKKNAKRNKTSFIQCVRTGSHVVATATFIMCLFYVLYTF